MTDLSVIGRLPLREGWLRLAFKSSDRGSEYGAPPGVDLGGDEAFARQYAVDGEGASAGALLRHESNDAAGEAPHVVPMLAREVSN